jgi:hypothetical protein
MNYLDAIAEQVRDELAPDMRPEDRAQELYRLYALLVLVKSVDCTLRDVHDAWATWMTAAEPEHDALVPFDLLSHAAQKKDAPYLAAIVRVASRRA